MNEHEPTNHGPANDESDTEPELRGRAESTLRAVRDPDADLGVFKTEPVGSITVDRASVTVRAAVTEFDDANAAQVMRAMAQVVRDVPAVESAHVGPVSPPSSGGATGVDAFDTVIAAASTKDGVGKSAVSAGLAYVLAGEHSIGLFDADIHGPNVPSLPDVEGPIHSSDEGHPLPVSMAGPDASLDVVNVGLMESGVLLAQRGAIAHDALTELFADTAWSADDTLILDLPPRTSDVALTTLQKISVDGVVAVTTSFESSLKDTARSVELFRDNEAPVLGAVVNMCEFACPSCGDTHRLFLGETASEQSDVTMFVELLFSPRFQETSTPGDATPMFGTLVEPTSEATATAQDVDVPDGALDIRGDPPEQRKERVAERFTVLANGETFVLVSDRDPTPVRRLLGGLTDRAPAEINRFSIERRASNDWLLTVMEP